MKTWSANAQQELEQYLDAVRGSLDAPPDEAQETLENLRAHILLEAEDEPISIVTAEWVRTIIAKVGTPATIAAGTNDWAASTSTERRLPLKHVVLGAVGLVTVMGLAVAGILAGTRSGRPAGEISQHSQGNANEKFVLGSLPLGSAAKRGSDSGQPAGDGTYTAESIAVQDAAFFIARMSQPQPGYHGFAGLWALETKTDGASEEERRQIIRSCLETISDMDRPFQERFQTCYVVSRFHDPAIVETLAHVLRQDPNATLRGVAACALGQEASAEALSALRDAASQETNAEVLSWINRAIAGEFHPAEITKPGTGPGPVQEEESGAYTAEAIATHDADYFLARMERPDDGYHRFAALWALQIKADQGSADQRKQIIQACLDAAADNARSFNQRFQCCYVVTVFDDPAIVPALTKILNSDPNPQLRNVAACALAQTQTSDGTAALEAALTTETDPDVQTAIQRGLAGEFTKPIIPQPATSAEAT